MVQHPPRSREDQSPSSIRTADILGALSVAGDLAVGMPAGHAARSCYIGMHLADRLQLSQDEKASLYYAELLMDAGCTSWASHLAAAIMGDEMAARRDFFFYRDARKPLDVLGWLQEYMAVGAPAHVRARRILDFALHGKEFVRESLQNTAEVAQHFAQRLGMPDEVVTTLWSVFEQWDGAGPNGMRGERVPVISRIVSTTSLIEAFHSTGGRTAAIRLAEGRKGTAFDPAIVEAFLSLAREDSFWEGLEQEWVWTTVLALEPDSPYRYLRPEMLHDVARSFADFADLKSFYATGHSRRVGELADRIATQMVLGKNDIDTIRLAALMHDLGLVAVPSFTLNKAVEQLTPAEWEQLRLHPYHAERILSRVPSLESVVPLVAAHHERMDGRGYYRGLSGSQIPLGARIISVADRFDDLTHDTSGHSALDTAEALARMSEEEGTGLCTDSFQALCRALQSDGLPTFIRSKATRRAWPAGLTDREVEILRLLAKGLSRRQMAEQLYLSEHTVRHHLEHIYNKIGVSTRVAATLFAVEHDLLQ